ncbi:MAG TPA: Hsp20/alpha crystallin family protein [Longimicrobiales bacterium]|nr:Hsp20/alpha crystallin family protein [Longimicrobiales bacterium]
MLPMQRGRHSALGALLDVSREMDRLVNRGWEGAESPNGWPLPTEVVETDDEIRFDLEAPGFRVEDIEITLENNVLTIAGEKRMEQTEERKETDYRLFERRYGRFQRSFTVPPTVRGDECQARYENGVLTVRLPKREEAKPRRIHVDVGSGARQIETAGESREG